MVVGWDEVLALGQTVANLQKSFQPNDGLFTLTVRKLVDHVAERLLINARQLNRIADRLLLLAGELVEKMFKHWPLTYLAVEIVLQELHNLGIVGRASSYFRLIQKVRVLRPELGCIGDDSALLHLLLRSEYSLK